MKRSKKKTQKIVFTKDGIQFDEVIDNPFNIKTRSKIISYNELPKSFPPLLLKSIKPNISDKNVLESLTLIVYKDEKNKKSKIVTKSAKENKNKTFILNGKDYKAKNEYEILKETCEFLIREGKLNSNTVPIDSGHYRYIVNVKQVHKNGKKFFLPQKLSNGLYMEAHNSYETTIKNARKLLKTFGYPESILVIKDKK